MGTRTAATSCRQFSLRSLLSLTALVAVALGHASAYGVEVAVGVALGLCLLGAGVARRRWNLVAAGGLILLYLGLVYSAPEASERHVCGVVLLGTWGHGYSQGDVVLLASPAGCGPDAIVLYDWEKARPGGFGPPFILDRYGDLTSAEKKYVVARVVLRIGRNYVEARRRYVY